ncbi:right-handed parallel beta-helix repeat-containing protein [Massilia sp. IC2-477]|uniref:right-handed parallel beta-helix repeat-containing protein n=1 Tax=Massilia sp. IC2-477 TaxID=2887198 RepID=UPI001D0FBD7A|nr:right-handed parallel beta-helix repeat-containing protein [Massilia sp. IC2-477]MCC2955031.1 right-handed parallel beta-helix repeat-containing protein [Massilia sp. IC2-477]
MRPSRLILTRTVLALACATILAPASAATLSVGAGKTYARPCQAFAAAKAGDIVEIAGNATYSGDVCGIYASNLTIRGVNGRPKIDAAGQNSMGKAIWVVVGDNVVIENVEMFGAKVPDQNGAALRLEGTNFTLRSSYLHDNENGILTGVNLNSNILIENSEFGRNGYGTGYTHNLYIGNVGSLTFRYNYSHDANVGHNLKSRARINTIAYNRFSSLPEGQAGSGKPSYEINLPNAGTSYIIGNVIQQPAAHNNPNLIAYGEEGASNPGHDLYVVNNTFLNDDTSRGNFVLVGSGVTKPILLQNNIFGGTGTLSNQVGAIEKTNYRAAAPGFVNRAAYDLRPTANALVIDAGSAPGVSAAGVALAPGAQYKHVAGGEARPAGLLDIGAYEAASVTTAPAPTSWVTCATEWGTCSFSGSREVRYGTATAFVTKTVSGPVRCANSVFGDPAPGAAKSCSYAVAATTGAAPADVSWTACASQYGICTVPGTREVRYGAAGSYATMIVTNSVKCSDAVFGDPKPGVAKSCSYSSVAR